MTPSHQIVTTKTFHNFTSFKTIPYTCDKVWDGSMCFRINNKLVINLSVLKSNYFIPKKLYEIKNRPNENAK